MKGFALSLVLKQRYKRTRKWPITDDFSSFKNSTKEARLLRKGILSEKFRCLNLPDLQTFTYCIKNKSKSFTGKSEQNITTIKPVSLESIQKDGVISSCCLPRNALSTSKKWRSAIWLIAMHSGKK